VIVAIDANSPVYGNKGNDTLIGTKTTHSSEAKVTMPYLARTATLSYLAMTAMISIPVAPE
jgi:hypothetical protein